MCLLVLGWKVHTRFELIVAANRDEFHDRPTAPLSRWNDPPGLLAGRDLRAGGTWLGVADGAFGAITNFREPSSVDAGAPSRGELIPRFVASHQTPRDYLAGIEPAAQRYAGFNLLLARAGQLWYASNRTKPFAKSLEPGVYGLSNHTLDTPWPKLERIRAGFARLLSEHPDDLSAAQLLALLDQREPASADKSWEEVLAAPFVVHPTYGTRSSTAVLIASGGAISITERRFDPDGRPTGETALGTSAA